MNLDTTTRSLEVKLGEAITTSQCDITASFGEYVGAGFRPRSSNAVTNGVTAVTAVAAPATSEQLVVQEVRVYNADTVTHLVILQLNDNATIRVIQAGEVLPGATFSYLASGPTDANEAPSLLLETGLVSLKISELTAAATMDGTEQLPVNQGGVTVRSTAQDVLNIGIIAGTGAVSITAVNAGDTVTVASADVSAGTSGYAYLYSGSATGSGASGTAFVFSGDVTAGSGTSGLAGVGSGFTASGKSGLAQVYSGDSTGGPTGDANLQTGDAGGGNSGTIIIKTGTATATRGTIELNGRLVILTGLPTVAPATTGALWRDAAAGNVVKTVP